MLPSHSHQVVSDTVLNLVKDSACARPPQCPLSYVLFLIPWSTLYQEPEEQSDGPNNHHAFSWNPGPKWTLPAFSCFLSDIWLHLCEKKLIKSPGTESEGKLLWVVPSCDWSVSRRDLPKGNCEGLSAPTVWVAFFVLILLQSCWMGGKWLDFNTGTGRNWKLLISRNGCYWPLLTSTQ